LPRVLPPTWHTELALRLRILREARGLTQQKVAKHLECSFQMVQKYEKATARLPADTAITLARLYKVDLKVLLGVRP
jgi:transcriptional regulator with XRE-family HTH domain